MILLCLILCITLLSFVFAHTRDMASPAFVTGAIWTAGYLIVLVTVENEYSNSIYYMSFFGAFLCFTIGFFCVCTRYNTSAIALQENIKLRKSVRNLILVLCNVLAIYQIVYYLPYIDKNISFFRAMRVLQRNEGLSAGIASTPIEIAFFVMVSLYLINPTRENRRNVIFAMPCLFSLIFTSSTRGTWFYLLISLSFMVVYIKRIRNKKIVALGILGIVIIILIFGWTSYDYAKAISLTSFDEIVRSVRNSFKVYFALPTVAFVRWAETTVDFFHGEYTFRFFFALLHEFYPKINVVNTIMPFYQIDGLWGNVFTSLHWYAMDFGVGWALVANAFLGVIYGFLYSKCHIKKRFTLFYVVALSMLMYPIVYQCFSEVLFANLSLWIQRLLILFLMTLPGVCIVPDLNTEPPKRKIRLVWGKK